eukprot:4367388-Pleurochrysis_carterae.AAC.2
MRAAAEYPATPTAAVASFRAPGFGLENGCAHDGGLCGAVHHGGIGAEGAAAVPLVSEAGVSARTPRAPHYVAVSDARLFGNACAVDTAFTREV